MDADQPLNVLRMTRTAEQRHLINRPQRTPLELCLLPGDEEGPVGVFVHGFRSSMEGEKSIALVEMAAERGRSWLRFNMADHSHGGNDLGTFRTSRSLEELETVIEWLAPRPVVLVGSSFGGWLSLLAAQYHPKRVAGLVLIAPAINFIQYYFGALPPPLIAQWQKERLHTFTDPNSGEGYTLHADILQDANRCTIDLDTLSLEAPLRVLHGELDEVVPVEISRRLEKRLPSADLKVEVIPGGDHRLNQHMDRILHAVDEIWPH